MTLSLPGMCTVFSLISALAVSILILRHMAARVGSFVLPDLRIVTTASLSQPTKMVLVAHWEAQDLRARSMLSISNWAMSMFMGRGTAYTWLL